MHDSQTRRAEVLLRSYTPTSEPQNRVVAAAESLAEQGVFEDVAVERVPSAVPPDAGRSPAAERYERFTDWADREGVDVGRPFRLRETENRITGETVERLVLPIVSLAVYEDDRVAAVLPCETGDRSVSVTAYLAALSAGRDPLGTLSGSQVTTEEPEPAPLD